jgi:hypothetical protein
MHKSLRHASVVLTLLFAVAVNAHAGTIILSGDVNIVTYRSSTLRSHQRLQYHGSNVI